MPDRPSVRRLNAARPLSCIRPAASSSPTRLMLTALQVLRAARGVNRILWLSSSPPRRTPSIQPKQSASSSASLYVSPFSFAWTLYSLTTSSFLDEWLRSSHARNAAPSLNAFAAGASLMEIGILLHANGQHVRTVSAFQRDDRSAGTQESRGSPRRPSHFSS